MRPTRLPVVVVILLAGALAAGCTARQSNEQYEGHLKSALAVRTEVLQQLDAHAYADQAAYVAASRDVTDAVHELDGDAPPKKLQQAHVAMVHGMKQLAALLDTLGECAAREAASVEDGRACRRGISQERYDEIRDDFDEANTIYGTEGVSLPGIGGEHGAGSGSDSLGEESSGGDEL